MEPISQARAVKRRWTALAAAILLLSWVASKAPLVATLTGEAVAGAELTLPFSYLLLAPLGAVLDQLTFLTDRQHFAVVVSLLVVYLGWRVARHVFGASGRRGVLRRVGVELGIGAVFLASVSAVYGYGALGSRPMAAIRAHDPEIVVVDFHSHTDASRDGRRGLDIRTRRGWHNRAGFDVVYVTDHSHIETVLAALESNPARAGEGISLLPGIEVVYEEQHVIVLGTVDPRAGVAEEDTWPILIQTIPNDLSRVAVPDAARRGGALAIELVDADPRGLRQSREERALILAIADSLGLALVAGSNNHGWGAAAAAWTLVRVPGWREMHPEEVGRRIEDIIRNDGPHAAVVVERSRLSGGTRAEHPLLTATALPRLGWHILTRLSKQERVAVFGWVLLSASLRGLAPRTRRTEQPLLAP